MHLEQILKNLPLGVGTPYQKTGLKDYMYQWYDKITRESIVKHERKYLNRTNGHRGQSEMDLMREN